MKDYILKNLQVKNNNNLRNLILINQYLIIKVHLQKITKMMTGMI